MAYINHEGEALVVHDMEIWLKLEQDSVGGSVTMEVGDHYGSFNEVALTKENLDEVIAKLEYFRHTMDG